MLVNQTKGESMNHHFNVQFAVEYGLNEAIIFENLAFWCYKNLKNGKHIHEGIAWTYNSVRAFKELFPYMTESAIRRALHHLADSGLIKESHFTSNKYDRTKWYGVTIDGYKLLDFDISDFETPFVKNNKWNFRNEQLLNSTDNNTDNKPVNKQYRSNSDDSAFEEEFEKLWKLYPRKAGKKQAFAHFKASRKRGATFDEIEKGVRAYARKTKAEGTESRYMLHGDTFFRNERWADDYTTTNKFGKSSNNKLEQLKAMGVEL